MAVELSKRRDVTPVKRAAEGKLEAVEQRIADLERVRTGLLSLVQACPGSGPADACPILTAMGGDQE